MKTLFNQRATTEVLNRIDTLSQTSQAQWGKMDVAQMLAYCSAFNDIAMGKDNHKMMWLGLLIGRFVKPVFYNDKPLPRDMSTIDSTLIADKRDFETERQSLKEQIVQVQANGLEKATTHPHPFFGKFTPEQWGMGMYKHLDHHLRQFGV